MGVTHSYCNKLLRLHTHVHCVSNLLCAWAVTAAGKNLSVGLHVEIHCTLEYILHTWLWIECRVPLNNKTICIHNCSGGDLSQKSHFHHY